MVNIEPTKDKSLCSIKVAGEADALGPFWANQTPLSSKDMLDPTWIVWIFWIKARTFRASLTPLTREAWARRCVSRLRAAHNP